jgi:predicted DNA-binding transcriptional regulator YafY
MSVIKYVDRVVRIDTLIHLRATGTPQEFAGKLGIKRSTLFQTLQELRALGVDIRYSDSTQSYYYGDNKRIRLIIGN